MLEDMVMISSIFFNFYDHLTFEESKFSIGCLQKSIPLVFFFLSVCIYTICTFFSIHSNGLKCAKSSSASILSNVNTKTKTATKWISEDNWQWQLNVWFIFSKSTKNKNKLTLKLYSIKLFRIVGFIRRENLLFLLVKLCFLLSKIQ